MSKGTVIRKAAGGAATAGVLALLFGKTKDRLSPKPVNVTLELQSTDMVALSEQCRNELSRKREECVREIDEKTDRQTAALLMDCEESGMGLISQIRPEAEILSSNATDSPLRKVGNFLFSPLISLLIALAACGLLISVKWEMENTASVETAKMLNPVILASAAVAIHLLLNVIRTLIRNAPERSKKVTVGVKLTIPEKAREQFLQTQLKYVREHTMQIHKTYAAPSTLDDPTLALLSETYGDLCQAEVTEDMTDVFGFVKPKCARALKQMNVEIIDSYTGENAHLFTVVEAPGYGKSMVVKPALVLKNSGVVIARGEYVKDTE